MKRFDIVIADFLARESDRVYHSNGEFVEAEVAQDLLEALVRIFGLADDPHIGWRGVARSFDHFRCEYCGAESLDYVEMAHTDDCAVTLARAAIAKAKGADHEQTA